MLCFPSVAFDPVRIRQEFPILAQTIEGHPLVYLDNAATTQKPRAVLDAMTHYYETSNANAHRSMHVLAERATIAYEDARKTVQKFLHAEHADEIIFTKSCTEALNIVARGMGASMQEGDAVVLSVLEHHSTIVPWLMMKEEKGIDLLWMECDNEGHLKLDQLETFLRRGNVKVVSITAQSNVLGVRPELQGIIEMAHDAKAMVIVDAAQAIAHEPMDVAALDCDFLAFSGHKLYGPTGIGVLYGKRSLLESLPPLLGGGMMIRDVHEDRFSIADSPAKFEGGTQPIAEAVGLAAAIEWLTQCSWKDIQAHERALLEKARKELQDIRGCSILGPRDAKEVFGCMSFTIDGAHPHDLTEIVGRHGVCLRAGHHCAQVLHRRLGVPATTRLSVGIYNTLEDIEIAVKELKDALKRLQ